MSASSKVSKDVIDKSFHYDKIKNYQVDTIEFGLDELADVKEEIMSGLTRIKDIVASFREYTGVDIGTDEYAYDLNRGLSLAIDLLKPELPEGLVIKTKLEELSPLLINGRAVNSTLTHLLRNAYQAIEDKKKGPHGTEYVHIETRRTENTVTIRIKDTGVGMSEDVIKNAFDPFFTTRDVGYGKGLGLTICYETIVVENNGHISIESEPDKGTTVEISIPISKV